MLNEFENCDAFANWNLIIVSINEKDTATYSYQEKMNSWSFLSSTYIVLPVTQLQAMDEAF